MRLEMLQDRGAEEAGLGLQTFGEVRPGADLRIEGKSLTQLTASTSTIFYPTQPHSPPSAQLPCP